MWYSGGWELELSERRKIYAMIPTKYKDIYPRNLIHEFRAAEAPTATSGLVVGHCDNGEGQQVVIFEIDGSVLRPDNRPYQLDWSRDWVLIQRKPMQSWRPFIATDWTRLDEPFTVALIPMLFTL